MEVNDLIKVAITSLVSCIIGMLVSLIPLKHMVEKRLVKAQKDAEKREEFRNRRERISRGAISNAGKAFFWLERGCEDHEPKHWNGELAKAIADYRAVEKQLDDLDIEIIEEFNSDKK